MSNKRHTSRTLGWIVLAVLLVAFLVMNCLTGFKADDYFYMFVIDSFPMERVRNLGQLWQSWQSHCMTTNARLSNLLTHWFCALGGKGLFNVLNTLVMGALLVLSSWWIKRRKRLSLTLILLTMAYMLWLFPVPRETMLWVSGACNYLWSVTATLAIVWVIINNAQGHRSMGRLLLGALAALLAAMCNESVSIAASAGLLLWLVAGRCKQRGLAPAMTVGYWIGTLALICAPGVWVRLSHGEINLSLSLPQLLLSHIVAVGANTVRLVTPLLAIAIGLWMLKRRGWRRVVAHPLACLWIGALVTMLAFGVARPRAFSFYAMVSFLIVATALWRWTRRRRRMRLAVLTLSALAVVAGCAVALHDIIAVRHIDQQTQTAIAASGRECVLPAVTDDHLLNSRFALVTGDRTRSNILDICLSAYYDKDFIQWADPEIYALVAASQPLTTPDTVAASQPLTSPDTVALRCNHPELASPLYRLEGSTVVEARDRSLWVRTSEPIVLITRRDTPTPDRRLYYYVSSAGHYYWVLPPIDSTTTHITLPTTQGVVEWSVERRESRVEF